MRTLILAVIAVSSPAFADRIGGGGGAHTSSGPLGQVSAGLAGAAASSGNRASTGAAGSNGLVDRTYACQRYLSARDRDPVYRDTILEHDCRSYYWDPEARVRMQAEGGGMSASSPGAVVTGFAGVEKVIGSDGSYSLGLAVVDSRFRLDGSLTQYYENEMSGARVTMMAPELSAGIHLGADAPTRLWLQTGVMYLSTHDSIAGDTSNSGPTLGARIEHRASPDLTFAGTIEGAYLQDGVRGIAGRVGVRFHHVEAALRVLDFNVGPALYGPEIGVGF